MAFLAEGTSWAIAVRALLRGDGSGLLDKVRRSRDPTRFVVFAEDSAALLGIAFAVELSFETSRSAGQIARDVEDPEATIRARCPEVQRIIVEARSIRADASGGRRNPAGGNAGRRPSSPAAVQRDASQRETAMHEPTSASRTDNASTRGRPAPGIASPRS